MTSRFSMDPEGLSSPTPDEIQRAESVRPLADAVRMLLEAAGPRAQLFLHDWPRQLLARPLVARSLPVVSTLQGLSRFAVPQTQALVEQIAALAGELDWRQTYTSADFGERFLENYGWSEWVGQRGAFASDAIACGVLLLGPAIEYPAHSHEADELYLPLAGHAYWRAGGSGWRIRAPGVWIHHLSWTTHAVRTAREPLLAAYVWRAGDLTAKSRIDTGERRDRPRGRAPGSSGVAPGPSPSQPRRPGPAGSALAAKVSPRHGTFDRRARRALLALLERRA